MRARVCVCVCVQVSAPKPRVKGPVSVSKSPDRSPGATSSSGDEGAWVQVRKHSYAQHTQGTCQPKTALCTCLSAALCRAICRATCRANPDLTSQRVQCCRAVLNRLCVCAYMCVCVCVCVCVTLPGCQGNCQRAYGVYGCAGHVASQPRCWRVKSATSYIPCRRDDVCLVCGRH